jgi:hypothetical protein
VVQCCIPQHHDKRFTMGRKTLGLFAVTPYPRGVFAANSYPRESVCSDFLPRWDSLQTNPRGNVSATSNPHGECAATSYERGEQAATFYPRGSVCSDGGKRWLKVCHVGSSVASPAGQKDNIRSRWSSSNHDTLSLSTFSIGDRRKIRPKLMWAGAHNARAHFSRMKLRSNAVRADCAVGCLQHPHVPSAKPHAPNRRISQQWNRCQQQFVFFQP